MKKRKLVCIPYAGGMARDFEKFCAYFPKNMETIRVEYAGHGVRSKERCYENFQEMVEDVAGQINYFTDIDDDVCILGYSMGSIVLYELLSQNMLKSKITAAFFASHMPPDIEWASKQYYMLSDEEFIVKMRRLGGMIKCDDKMMNNRVFQKLYFEPLRQDYKLLSTYHFGEGKKLDVPAMVLYSPKDIPTDSMKSWKKFFEKQVKMIEIGENHFFIWDRGAQMAEVMMRFME